MKTHGEIVSALVQEKECLEKEFAAMREFHLAAWKEYGSELCSGEMHDKEQKLAEKITNIRKFLEMAGEEVTEESFQVTADHLKENRARYEETKRCAEKHIEMHTAAVGVVKELALIAGIKVR